jgi:hypothetical protein
MAGKFFWFLAVGGPSRRTKEEGRAESRGPRPSPEAGGGRGLWVVADTRGVFNTITKTNRRWGHWATGSW